MADEKRFVGIDLDATYIKGILVDRHGLLLKQRTLETCDTDAQSEEPGAAWKKAIYDLVGERVDESKFDISGIGLAAPGIPDSHNGT